MDEHDLLATCWTSAGDVRPGAGDESSPHEIAARIAAVASAGFSGMGLGLHDLYRLRGTVGFTALRRMLDDAGIVWIQLGTLDGWWASDGRREASDADRGILLEAAATLRAAHVVVGADTSAGAAAPDAMTDDWVHLATQAESVGAQLVLEPVPWSNLPTIERASRWVMAAGHANGGLLVDAMHVHRGGSTMSSILESVDPASVFAVELSDGLLHTPSGMTLADESRDARHTPGSGAWDLPAFVRTMRALGHDEPWGVEVCTPSHRATPIAESLQSVATATRAVLDAADAATEPAPPPMPSTPAPASAVDLDLPHPTV